MKTGFVPENLEPFADTFWPYFMAMMNEVNLGFVLKPNGSCCGKPIVFPHPQRTFKCDRCEKTYELVVEIKEVAAKTESSTKDIEIP